LGGAQTVVVVPSAREASLAGFLEAWREELAEATVLVIEDGPERTFATTGTNVQHFAWCDIEEQLGDAAGSYRAEAAVYARSAAGSPTRWGRT
jgi:hypothetical protein